MAGRPTKLTKSLIERAAQYNHETDGDVIPTIEAFALHLEVSRETVYAWRDVPPAGKDLGAKESAKYTAKRKLHQQFSDIVNDLLAQQSRLLVQNGLTGKFNANITRLILSGKHGYVEKQQTDLTTNGKDLPTPILGGVSVRKDGDE